VEEPPGHSLRHNHSWAFFRPQDSRRGSTRRDAFATRLHMRFFPNATLPGQVWQALCASALTTNDCPTLGDDRCSNPLPCLQRVSGGCWGSQPRPPGEASHTTPLMVLSKGRRRSQGKDYYFLGGKLGQKMLSLGGTKGKQQRKRHLTINLVKCLNFLVAGTGFEPVTFGL
jgi:hypothetical protein